ncbi:hypothetical protein C2845_PM07G04190 [Panicum miliaceum]|uniref:Uncharacterized protein n=1 Tax=Panicum miliaceum TaxID=4540 RepID=A0A3L6SNJ6_PANMI|nr:hypothetical protein C2845_PM07G04190 [Panicum miliaceum]
MKGGKKRKREPRKKKRERERERRSETATGGLHHGHDKEEDLPRAGAAQGPGGGKSRGVGPPFAKRRGATGASPRLCPIGDTDAAARQCTALPRHGIDTPLHRLLLPRAARKSDYSDEQKTPENFLDDPKILEDFPDD